MSAADRERLLRALGEAAALPPTDPERQRVASEVAAAGDWAEEAWLDLLREDERLRLDLRRVPVPDGLEERLLRIASRPERRRWPAGQPWLAAAAVLAVALAAAWLLLGPVLGGRERSARLQTAALLAVTDHMNDRHLVVRTADPAVFNAALSRDLPFAVELAAPSAGFELLGGRRCTLGPHPVAYSLWQRAGTQVSLFQVRAADFGLPADFPTTRVVPRGPAGQGLRCGVVGWAAQGRLYLLVADSAAALP